MAVRIWLSVVLSVVVVAGGCARGGGGGGGSPSPAGPATATAGAGSPAPKQLSGDLTTLFFGQGDEIAKVRVDLFKKQNPNVRVKITEGGFEPQQFQAALAGGSPPDIVYIPREQIGSYAARQALQPLDQCISTAGIDMGLFREAAVSQVTVNGQIYGIPDFSNVVIVIVNNAALKEAGLTPEDVDTGNWDRLRQANEKLVKKSGAKLTRMGFDPKLPEFLPLWARANGVSILSEDGKTSNLDDPKVAEALEYTVGLLKAQVDRPSTFKDVREALSTDFFGPKNPIATNVLGAFVMEQWYLGVLAENSPNVDITVQPFKGRDGQPLTFATGDAWAIPKGAKNPDAACEFMKVMTATESWVAAAQARAKARAAEKKPFSGVNTANKEAFERINTEVVKPSGNPKFDDALKVVQSVQDAAYSIPASAAGAEFKQAWEEAVNSVLTGEMSVQDALKQADQDAQDALDKAAGG